MSGRENSRKKRLLPDDVTITLPILIMLSCKCLGIGSATSCFIFNNNFKPLPLMEFSKADNIISSTK